MISAHDLLMHADDLVSAGRRGTAQHISLRRAVSAAYYGLFHYLLTDATDGLIGKTKRSNAAYSLIYRSFEHRKMRDRATRAINLPQKLRASLGIANFSMPIRYGAAAFVQLQAERHRADYDPNYKLSADTARTQISLARDAITAFSTAAKEEYELFLVLLLFDPRD